MKMLKKYCSAILVLMLAIGAGSVVAGCSSSSYEGGDEAAAAEESAEGGQDSGAQGDLDAAQALVDQTLTKDEIEAKVGAPNRFEMNSEGCERGVYGGYFYYDNMSIFSVTYDKGKTFTVKSVSE